MIKKASKKRTTSWFRGIQANVIFKLLPIIILIPILLAVVTYIVQKKSVVNISEDHLGSVVSLKSRSLEEYFSRSRETLMILASVGSMKDMSVLHSEGTSKGALRRKRKAVGVLRGYLRGALTTNSEFDEFLILDPEDGRVLISSNLKEEGKVYRGRSFFTHSRLRAFTTPFQIMPGDKEPIVYSAVPIESSAGVQIGVLVARHSMEPIHKVVGELPGSANPAHTYLFNEHYIVLNPESRIGPNQYYTRLQSEGTEKAFILGLGSGVYQGVNQEQMVGSFHALGQFGIALIAQETLSRVIQPLSDLRENLILVSIGVTLLALLALWFISRQIVRPLSHLGQTVNRYSEGDFTARAEVKSQNEIGVLAENFNHMASSLEKLYGGLEDQVKKRTEELVSSLLETEEARSEWEDTFHALSDGLFIYDDKEKLRRINRSAEQIISRKESVVQGKSVLKVLPVAPKKDQNGQYPDFKELKEEETGHIYRISHFLKKDPKGVVKGGVFVLRDITDESQREAEYKDVQTQLIEASKLAAVGTLSAGVAHEFNNLIAGIRLHADLALSMKDAGKMERALQVAVASSEKAAKIISSLLVFSRRKSSDKKLENLEEVFNETASLVEADFDARGIELIRDFKKLPQVPMDRSQISQVVLNLLTNARDAVLQQSKPSITIKLYQKEDEAILEVGDNGEGISEDVKQKIFEPFFTTKGLLGGGTQSAPGTGLGLSISYGIIQSHDGTIEVKSQTKKGTTFIIRLPITPSKEIELEEAEVQEVSEQKITEASPCNVLVVDDEEPIRNAIKETLESKGHQVWIATDGREGVELFKQCKPDILFVDMLMPGLSGQKMLEQLNLKDKQSKIVVMSGAGFESFKGLSKLGVHSLLKKPFSMAELEARFHEVATQ